MGSLVCAGSASLALAQIDRRSVHGLVLDRRGARLRGAVVQLENTATKEIRSYIVQADGKYHFNDLSQDIDYILRARYRNAWGPEKRLSKFKSERDVDLNLTVDTVKEE